MSTQGNQGPGLPVPGQAWVPGSGEAPFGAPAAAGPAGSADPAVHDAGRARWLPAAVPGWLALLGALALGALSGVVALLWQGWSTVLTSPGIIVLPWGAVLAVLAVFATAVSWGLRCARRWVPGVVGLVAFVVLGAASMDTHNQLLAPLDARYVAIAPGAVWSAIVTVGGVILATIVALLIVSRHVPALPRRR